MSGLPKEKIVSNFRKIFKADDGSASGANSVKDVAAKKAKDSTESPPRRVRRQDQKIKLIKSFNDNDLYIRNRRLMKEFRELENLQNNQAKPLFTVELVNDNLAEWFVRLYGIDPESQLAKDMAELNIPYILLHLEFPNNFPFSPPFMRVVKPHIVKGFILDGGAICMELLTPRGWASAYTIEALLIQFAASVVKGRGRILTDSKNTKAFSRRAAEESFRSLVRTHDKHGWYTPALSDG